MMPRATIEAKQSDIIKLLREISTFELNNEQLFEESHIASGLNKSIQHQKYVIPKMESKNTHD